MCMSNPFFSVITPAYNRAYILPETISSVLRQTFTDWEMIVVDDGSKDNTQEVVNKITDSRVRYIYQENAERSAARNNGISNALGKYICFLDSDDWYEPEHLQILYDNISDKYFPEAMFFTNCYYFQHNKKIIPVFPVFTDPKNYLLLNPVIPARVCIHSDILKKYRFREDIVIVEDQVLWVTIAFKYPVFYIPVLTVVYHLHEDNSVNIKNNCYKPRLDGLRLLFKQPETGSFIPKVLKRNIIGDCYYGISKHYFYKKNFVKMMLNLFYSFLYKPFSAQNKAKLFMIYLFIFKPNAKTLI